MPDNFKAIVLNQDGENFKREIKSIDKSFLKHGDVTVKVDYSDLNFKDGMILKMVEDLLKSFLIYLVLIFQGQLLKVKTQNSKKAMKLFLQDLELVKFFMVDILK